MKNLEKISKLKASRREIIRTSMLLSEIENSKTRENINETKSWIFEKINRINKLLARWTKEKAY